MQAQASAQAAASSKALAGSLARVRPALAVAMAAHVMAQKGITRASGQEVARQANQAYGTSVTASQAGLLFTDWGVKRTLTRGRSRLVLDANQLESIVQSLEAEFEGTEARLEQIIAGYEGLGERVADLEQRWQELVARYNREKVLREALQKYRNAGLQVASLEREVQQRRAWQAQEEQLRRDISELEERAKKVPDLQQKRATLQAAVEAQEKEEKQLTAREQALGWRLEELKRRAGWVQLADLQTAIVEATGQLEEVRKQLGEKRSLLGKVLLRRREGEGQ